MEKRREGSVERERDESERGGGGTLLYTSIRVERERENLQLYYTQG